jgi:hypothetical protein
MSIQLSKDSTTVTLPDGLLWIDETTWQPVAQEVERSITGALIIQSGLVLAGRPVTLEPADENSAWMPRADLDQLLSWAAVPDAQMTLNLRGASRTVMWRHQDAPVIDATPVVPFDDVQPGDFWVPKLRLMEI